jgi:U3 small nucleolar RNA-associated protein 3
LGYSSESEEYDEEHDEAAPRKRTAAESSEEDASEEEDEDAGGWGNSKKDYYNNDQVETEADALEEEAEAKRLQQKKLQKMSEADFGFDETEWLDAGNDEEGDDVVTEVLKDVEITPDMIPEDRLRILNTRYPEFDFLANEFVQLQPVLQDLQQHAETETASKTSGTSHTTIIKCRALAAYMASLTMYFALLTSPAKNGKMEASSLDPAQLRDHAVMDSLLQCRELWSKVKFLKAPGPLPIETEDKCIDEIEVPVENGQYAESADEQVSKKTKDQRVREAAARKASALRTKQIKEAEETLADLSSLIPKSRKAAKKAKTVAVVEDDSDFGEEESIDARSAAEKAKKKKSLRFYTSQIAQKANKRAGAGREAGGDADLPHRERLRDRQARLNAEAEKRGKKLDEYGRGGRGAAALGEESDSGEDDIAEQVRDEGDEYYDMVAKNSKKKKLDKQERMEAIKKAKAEGATVRIVEGEVDEDGKREISYSIEKNRGLAPKRKKDVRNPRVKKRKKFEEKKKKLASTRAVYKGGEERGGYGGEKTGIKSSLVKSIKL